jgi:hypothetical protein
MRRIALLSTGLLLCAMLMAETGVAIAKHGKHHHHHGDAYARFLPSPRYGYAVSATPLDEAPVAAPVASLPHAEWCTRTYQTYDTASDTFLRFDGVRVPCIGP